MPTIKTEVLCKQTFPFRFYFISNKNMNILEEIKLQELKIFILYYAF